MKTKNCFILLILLSLAYTGLQTQPLYSDYYINPLNTWSAVTGGVVHFDDTTYMAGIGGYNYGYNVEKAIIFLKVDGEGVPVYQKLYGEMGHEYYAGSSGCFRRVGNDHFVLPIVKRNLFTNELSSILYYLNRDFDTLYVNEFMHEDGKNTLARKIVPALDGGYYVTGGHAIYDGDTYIGQNMFILKTDAKLNILWQKSNSLSYRTEPLYMETTPDHGLLISGFTEAEYQFYSRNPFIAKTDSLGNLEWVWNEGSYPYSYDDGWAVCGITSDGDYMIAYSHATYQGPPYPVPDSERVLRLVKLSPQGAVVWTKEFGPSDISHDVWSLLIKDDGTSLVAGSIYDTQVSRWKSYILNFNNDGDSLWMREYEHIQEVGPATKNQIFHLNLTPSNTILAVGGVEYHYPPGLQAMWIMHLDEYGCPIPNCDTTVSVKPIMIAKQSGISVYPNPASTHFFLHLPENEQINRENEWHIRIFNAKGRLVLQKNIPNNNGNIHFEIDGWLPGLYLLQVSDRNLIVGHTKLLVK